MTPAERTVRYIIEHHGLAGRIDRREGPIERDWPHARGVPGGSSHGFADVLAIWCDDDRLIWRVWLIQATSRSNHAARARKVLTAQGPLTYCVGAGVRVEVWSWGEDDEPRRERIA